MQKEWQWNDAWWLQSLYMSNGSIMSIIACGDYINHAVFTYEEFDVAAAKFCAAGIVKNKEVFLIDKNFKQEYEKRKPGRNPLKEADKMLALLQQKVEVPVSYSTLIERKTFQKALDQYLQTK